MSWETQSLWVANHPERAWPPHVVICNHANWGHVRHDVEAINPSFDVKILAPSRSASGYLHGSVISGYTFSQHLALGVASHSKWLLLETWTRELDLALARYGGEKTELRNV